MIFTRTLDGVCTGDPRIVPNAKKMDSINFEEMLELSSLGAKKVLHTTVSYNLALQYGVKLQVLSEYSRGKKGTMLVKETKSFRKSNLLEV